MMEAFLVALIVAILANIVCQIAAKIIKRVRLWHIDVALPALVGALALVSAITAAYQIHALDWRLPAGQMYAIGTGLCALCLTVSLASFAEARRKYVRWRWLQRR